MEQVFRTLYQTLYMSEDFISQVNFQHRKRFSYLQRQYHWSRAKWRKKQRAFEMPILPLCPLSFGVYTDVINIDRFNLFLLGLRYYSTMVFLSGLLFLHEISMFSCGLLKDVVSLYFAKRPKKPPDILPHHQKDANIALVACSSVSDDTLEDANIYCDDFDSERTHMVGLDSLCSRHLFPVKADFVSEISPIEPFGIQGVGGDIKAIGKGTVRIRFYCDKGIPQDKLLLNAYYAPKCPVRLISIPQLARDTNESSSLCTGGNQSILTWQDVQVTVPHPSPSDVPFMRAQLGAPKYRAFYSLCAMAQSSLADQTNYNTTRSSVGSHHGYHATELNMDGDTSRPSVIDTNDTLIVDQASELDLNDALDQNIDHLRSLLRHPMTSPKQLEYQSWHHRLGHLSHSQMQDLVKQGKLPKQFLTCKAPVCPACLFAKQVKRSWRHKNSSGHHLRSLAQPFPGSLTFADQMISTTPGLIAQSTGKLTNRRFRAATVFVDSYSDFTYVHLQEDLTMDSTLDSKLAYEKCALSFGVQVQGYHADNGRFADTAWKESCDKLRQRFSYCGVGAHHQNGVVERRIRDLSSSARAALLHAIHLWPDGVSKNLWPYALRYACLLRNRVRLKDGSTPEALFSRTKQQSSVNLSQFHPFGCPAYVLDDRLQGDNKIPRWEPRSRLGVYLGHSPYHAQNVALVLNLTTGHVSPQYHVVYDDDFTTVDSLKLGTVPTNWPELYNTNSELVTAVPFQLSPEWNQTSPAQNTIHLLTHELDSEPTNSVHLFDSTDASVPPIVQSEGASIASEGVSATPEGDFTQSSIDPISGNIMIPVHQFTVDSESSLQMPEPVNFQEAGLRRSTRTRKPTERLLESHLFGLSAIRPRKTQRFNLRKTILRTMSFASLQIQHHDSIRSLDDGTMNSFHPLAFSAALADNEVFHYGQAMKQPDRVFFIKAMIKEVDDLTRTGVWELRKRSEIGNV